MISQSDSYIENAGSDRKCISIKTWMTLILMKRKMMHVTFRKTPFKIEAWGRGTLKILDECREAKAKKTGISEYSAACPDFR